MERGQSSNQQHKYTTRASSTSGIVIREGGGAVPNDIPAGDVNRPQAADRYMPTANLVRIMRGVLPPHAKIADDAKEAIQDSVSSFIGLVTTAANNRCHQEYRKTITAEDLLAAMASLGFNNYVEPLTIYLNKHRAHEDPERGPNNRLAVVRRRRPAAQLLPPARVARLSSTTTTTLPPPPPLPPVTLGYRPEMPPAAGAQTVLDPNEYIGLPQIIMEYFSGNQGGGGGEEEEGEEEGEGSSSGEGFDSYYRQFK